MVEPAPGRTDGVLGRYARWGLWALPVWAALLMLSTLTHQPSAQTDFPGYARYVTTDSFLISHIIGSILGVAFGVLGMIALFVTLVRRGASRLALWALVTFVIGNVLNTSVFGVAAFAQPAIGRAFLAGQMEAAIAINSDMYGGPLLATVLPGLLLFTAGVVLFGAAVARCPSFPRLAGIGLVVSGLLFAVVGFLLSNFIQPLGAALMVASTAWIARAAGRD
jgi:hypothetical protein